MTWLLWAVVLLIQNMSFTFVSRARNSNNVWYHAVAAVCSNGVWFVSQIVVIDKITKALHGNDHVLLAATLVFYTVFTVAGAILAHHILMRHVEPKIGK